MFFFVSAISALSFTFFKEKKEGYRYYRGWETQIQCFFVFIRNEVSFELACDDSSLYQR
jgi:hypothetical protein